MKKPLISIIVPIYNTEQYLPECLDSVLNQSFCDYEIICVNDGSTDNSEDILVEYLSKDNRIRGFNQNNGGLSAARNTGLDQAKGQFVTFLDSDDQMEPEALSIFVSHISAESDGIVSSCNIVYQVHHEMKESDEHYYAIPFEGEFVVTDEIVNRVHVCAWSKLYRMELINRYHLRFPEGMKYEDFYWHWCYFSIAKKVTLIKNKTVRYFRRPGTIMSLTFEKKEESSIDHLLMMGNVCEFFRENNLWESKKEILPRLFESRYWLAIQHSPEFEKARILGTLISLLRKWEIDCRGYDYLKNVREGNYDIVVGDIDRSNTRYGKPNFKVYVKYKFNKLFGKFR